MTKYEVNEQFKRILGIENKGIKEVTNEELFAYYNYCYGDFNNFKKGTK